jgi:hypothetical protein
MNIYNFFYELMYFIKVRIHIISATACVSIDINLDIDTHQKSSL